MTQPDHPQDDNIETIYPGQASPLLSPC